LKLQGLDKFQSVLINVVSAADDYSKRADAIIYRHRDEKLMSELKNRTKYGAELLSGAQSYMQSGFNSFQSLRLLVLPGGINLQDGQGSVNVNFTINGMASLLRQSIECLVRAEWLFKSASNKEIDERGFAVLWSNAQSRLKYERSLKSPLQESFITEVAGLRQAGIDLGFFNITKESLGTYAKNPRVEIADATGLLRNVKTPTNFPSQLLVDRGSGFSNAEWVYVWLSGLAHGMHWAHKLPPTPADVESEVFQRVPDYERFAIASLYVLQLGQNIFQLAENEFAETHSLRQTLN